MKQIASLLALLILASCVAPKAPPPAPAPAPAPPPPPPPAAPAPVLGWQDAPITPGSWVYRADQRGSVAMFGRAGIDADLLVRCDRAARSITLSRGWPATTAAPGAMTIAASAGSAAFPVQPVAGANYVSAAVGASDSRLDRMAYSRGRFAIELGGQRIIVPAWAEFVRVIEDCRG